MPAVVAELSDSEPCLVLVSLEGLLPDAASPDWAMIAWTPADAPVKLRMLCASSRRTLREEFADFSFREYNATERSEVTLAQYVESTRDRTEDDRHAAMTRDEIDQEEVRKQVAKEQASAPKLLAGLAALQVRTQPSFEDSMKRFLEKTEGSAVIAKLDSEELGAELIEAASISSLRGKLPAEPCFVVTAGEGNRLVFITWLPEGVAVKQKMKTSTFKASVVENVRSFAGDMEVSMAEAGDDDDLEDDLGAPRAVVSEEASPVPKATGPRPPAGGIALPGFGPPSPLKPTSPSRGEGGGYAQTSPLFKEKEKMDEKSVFDAKPQAAVAGVAPSQPQSAAIVTEFFSLQELQDSSFWKEKNVVATERERYLRDDVFQTLFGMDKEAFAKLPKWKRDNKKKEQGLF